MLILLDHGTPAPLRLFLKGHTVRKAKDLGWDTLTNGELLKAAEEAAFDCFSQPTKTSAFSRTSRSALSPLWF